MIFLLILNFVLPSKECSDYYYLSFPERTMLFEQAYTPHLPTKKSVLTSIYLETESADTLLQTALPFSLSLFIMGLIGIRYNKNNVLILMLCLEILLLASTINFIVYSLVHSDPTGEVYALYIITVAACESAIGLSLLVAVYRLKGSITFDKLNRLRG